MSKDILYPLRRIHGRIYEWEERQKYRKKLYDTIVCPIKRQLQQNPDAVLLLMTPEHGNMGDQAIAFSETQLLREYGIPFVEINGGQLKAMQRCKQLHIMNGFPLMISGGGNLGTLWIDVERLQREIILNNPKSNILFFPNTIYYEDSEWGREELEKSIQIYNGHKHLIIYAREEASYDFMKPIYKDVRLMPDMVMSLKKDQSDVRRSGCLLCLRSDCERTRTDEQEQIVRDQARTLFGDEVQDTDMVEGEAISVSQREIALERKFAQFSKAKLVITDRLHGMIFCAITGTPCIVVDSKSPKVRGCYEWIRDLEYIRFADDVCQIGEIYKMIPDREHHYDNSRLCNYYGELAKAVKEVAYN